MDTIHISEDTRAGWHVVSAQGRVDSQTADALGSVLLAAIAAHPQVAVDCSSIEYLSSAGLRALLQSARAAHLAMRQFIVCAPNPVVKQVFDASRIDQVLTLREALPC